MVLLVFGQPPGAIKSRSSPLAEYTFVAFVSAALTFVGFCMSFVGFVGFVGFRPVARRKKARKSSDGLAQNGGRVMLPD